MGASLSFLRSRIVSPMRWEEQLCIQAATLPSEDRRRDSSAKRMLIFSSHEIKIYVGFSSTR